MMKKNLSRRELFDHFAGKSSLLQKEQIRQWLTEPAHQELYYQWLDEWERAHQHWQPDTEDDYLRLHHHLKTEAPAGEEMETYSVRRSWIRRQWFVAAASLLLLLAGYWFRQDILYQTYSTPYGAVRTIDLPDGSVVTLNANSSLRVPRLGFGSRTREVRLEGEAYFSVKHTPTHQKFFVRTDRDFSVEVLGTEFSVRKRDRGMQVVLDRGKVNVHLGRSDRQLTLKPGELVTLEPGGRVHHQQTPRPQTYSAWRSHRFVFDQTPLRDVGYILQENFGIQMHIESKVLAERSLSGEIEAKTADELLTALAEVFNLRVSREANRVIVRTSESK